MNASVRSTAPDIAEATLVVAAEDTAEALGSGDVPVLGTPRLLALMELAARSVAAATLPAGSTTVGISLQLRHLAPSIVGATVRARATITARTDRALEFDLVAEDVATGTVIGDGHHGRAIVDRARFLARAGGARP